MELRCLIIDDEPLARQGMEDFVRRTPFLYYVAAAANPLEALRILEEEPVDLLLLDIEMPGMTGLEFVQALPGKPAVIFTTAYREFAVEGFQFDAVDYLLKPIPYSRFLEAAQKARRRLNAIETAFSPEEQDHIFIRNDGQLIRIRFEEIRILEAAGDYVFIHTAGKRYMALLSLKQLEQVLPSRVFMRVHRSYIVALPNVDRLEGHFLHLEDQKIPISRGLYEEVYQRLIGNRLIERPG